jgi:hypothetical protein
MAETNGKSHEDLKLPKPGKTMQSFWHSELDDLADHRTPAELPSECCVVFIGSGYAGTSVAYNLVKSGDACPNSIAILEARQACSGATGRNGGHLRPDLYGHIPTYIERYGVDAAKQWAEYEIEHVQAIKQLIAEEQIDCDFTLTRSTDVWCNEEGNVNHVYDIVTSIS